MEKIAVLAWLLLALSAAPAAAQSGATPVLPGYLSTLGCYPGQTACFIPLGPGFNASGQATLSATTSSSRVALPAGAQTVIVTNAGPATAYVNIGGSAVTATTASTPVLVGYPVVLQAGSNGYIAAITASSTAALTITTGSGIPAPNPSGGGLSGNVSNASDGVATSSTNIGAASWLYGWNSATWDRISDLLNGATHSLSVDVQTTGNLYAAMTSALPAGTNVIGYTSNDPCAYAVKQTADFESTSSGGNLITGTTAKITYICSIRMTASTQTNFSLCEATGAACSGGTPAAVYLNTGVTAANGATIGQSATVGGGLVDNGGNGTVAKTATTGQNVDVLFVTTNTPQVNVHVTYVQQ